MKRILFLITFILIGSFKLLYGQNNEIVVLSESDTRVVCKHCNFMLNTKPKEVQFAIIKKKNHLFFQVNDRVWFDQLFKNPTDGLAVEVVSKASFNCDLNTEAASQERGELLPPVYQYNLKRGLVSLGDRKYHTYVGSIPDEMLNQELEYNILFLNKTTLCRYYLIYHLETYAWDLLEMGMYLDSLTYNPKKLNPVGVKEDAVYKYKTLKFIIPFKKDKSEYSQKDIKPIYDSLHLTDYNIKRIKINAYASVEGSIERNLVLQKQRANTIINALQSFQKPTIKTKVSTSENWVEFLNDISGTSYDYLKKISQTEVKALLNGDLSVKLEPILKNHRKAVLELDLQKKDLYVKLTPEQLIVDFNSNVRSENVSEASKIQNAIFQKIREKQMDPDFLKKMEIPYQLKFVKILNKNAAFTSMVDPRSSLIVYHELLELEKISPFNPEIKYNIVASKIKLWANKALDVEEDQLKSDIYALKKYKIDQGLINRMLVNFHIIKAEEFMIKRDYANKDKAIDFINSKYKTIPLSDHDYLSLAQFLSYYSNLKASVKLLEDKAKDIDINEDLLFYYINLTITKPELIQDKNYRTIMLNAININKKRFCKLFNSIEEGGVTFQLLNYEYLRQAYCENCVE